ncbi:Cytochrome c [Rubripirellula tenax]|uniref:Cytochrome c n=1 Tax=Rubripirellula tenax TaxID=2528015 RepID=A0A5C6DYJ1_9BACT|nr:di-heme oxidoredictase family protein [Rubripirellula tenax]TWU41698.1 Cytochrome c [Rubripirellula tenax]
MKSLISSRRRIVSVGSLSIALIGWAYWICFAERKVTPEDIAAGRELFLHEWVADDPMCDGGDGLGPVFNAASCVACHSQGGVGGAGGLESNVLAFEADPDSSRAHVVSHVVHKSATRPEYQETEETTGICFPPIRGGARVDGRNGTAELIDIPVLHFEEINSPALFGVGLMDQVTEYEIALASAGRFGSTLSDNFNGKFSHNKGGKVRSHSFGRSGKFGWKGQFVSLRDFVASACAMELGLTNPVNSQPLPRHHCEDSDAALDMTDDQLHELVSFIRSLPAPKQIIPTDPREREKVVQGERFFNEAACNECHCKDVGPAKGIYSDFQLYSLELKLPRGGGGYYFGGDSLTPAQTTGKVVPRPNDVPALSQWKTPPLWGVADSAPYFHDGKSATLVEAVLRHDGDASTSKKRFQAMNAQQQAMLIDFLGSLRAPQDAEI